MGGGTWVHRPSVEAVPPVPPSATYRAPSGPKASPRGLFSPEATTVTVGRAGAWAPAETGTRNTAMTATVPMITLGMTVASNRRLSRFIDAPLGVG
jgi:hypothetical protein